MRSGISDYTIDLLPQLSRQVDVRLVLLPGQEVDPALTERWPSVRWERWLAEEPAGRLPLYQMGNNHHHRHVWQAAMERPGVLVLHDLVLHHFLIERTAAEGDLDAYSRELEACHGWIGAAVSRPLHWPGGVGTAGQFALPAHRSLLARQKGVLVHSVWARDLLAEEMPGLRVRPVPMGMPLPPGVDAAAGAAFRTRHGIPGRAAVLGSFGFQTPIKRTGSVIRALARPELEGVHLMIAGQASPGLDLEGLAREAGVSDRVHVLGFLPFEELEAAITACDLALNLRYPTAGETSASLLRILASGRTAVVSDHAQMADLPAAAVIHVPLGDDEEFHLAERLGELLADPGGLARTGGAARRHVAEHHRLQDAARAVARACAAWSGLDPPDVSPVEPGPPTSLTWSRFEGRLEVAGAELPWPPGERRRLRAELTNAGAARWLAGERLGGGVAVQVKLLVDGEDVYASDDWIGLPRDLEPGESHAFELTLRRPLAARVRLELVPHVLGFTRLGDLGGPSWARTL